MGCQSNAGEVGERVRVCVRTYIRLHVYVYVCIYVRVYACIHTAYTIQL